MTESVKQSGESAPSTSPGEVLLREFMQPYGLNPNRLALALGVAPNRISGIVNGVRGITAETAILLAEAFGTTAKFWIRLQADYDLALAQRSVSPQRLARAAELARELRDQKPGRQGIASDRAVYPVIT